MSVGQATENLPTLDEVRAAAELVYRLMLPTPQYRWPLPFPERLGTEVWVKHENHTPIGAFKARTAIVYAEELLKREPGTRGLIAATRGNHGQSVALAAQRKNLECVIVVPHGNSVSKNAAMRAQGAKLIEHGEDFQSSLEHAKKLATEMGFHLVPPYHRDIVLGIANPTGWNSSPPCGRSTSLTYRSAWAPESVPPQPYATVVGTRKRKLVGVVSDLAPTYALSWQQRKIVEAPLSNEASRRPGLPPRKRGSPRSNAGKCRPHRPRNRRGSRRTAMRAMFHRHPQCRRGSRRAAALAAATKRILSVKRKTSSPDRHRRQRRPSRLRAGARCNQRDSLILRIKSLQCEKVYFLESAGRAARRFSLPACRSLRRHPRSAWRVEHPIALFLRRTAERNQQSFAAPWVVTFYGPHQNRIKLLWFRPRLQLHSARTNAPALTL